MVEKASGKYHKAGALIDPSGKLVHAYRKVHLFATEKRMFTSGNEPAVIETDLGTFGLTICTDLLFPEFIRGLVLSGAEYILNSTDWLRWGPLDEWQWCHEQPRALARTRVLENAVGLAMASQWDEDGDYTKLGHSSAAHPDACSPGWRKAKASRCTNSVWRRSTTGARSARTSPTAATTSTSAERCQTPGRQPSVEEQPGNGSGQSEAV